ncbi:VOC family protein [Spongiactinospora sp. 9N601]|uniref:VOC family protein n=1 Tax=Spongiactinospora sp. 9N601 TaxID=3375149 RepID=UPI0037BE1A4B
MNVIASAVSLNVDDVAASSNFFVSHLGFHESLTAAGLACLTRSDAAADIILHLRGGSGEPPAGVVVVFGVTGVAAEYERLRAEGAALGVPLCTEPWGERYFELTDPNGIVVRLTEWVPPSGG